MKTSGKSWARYIDKSIKAKKSGYRKSSETGERYYEERGDHSDKNPKERYAKGGSTEQKERGALSKREKDFIKEELKNGKGQGFSYRAKILNGQEVVIRSKNGTPIKKWAFDSYKIALKIALKLNRESNKQDGYPMAKGGKTKKDPPIVRGYFEDEAVDYAKGGKVSKAEKEKLSNLAYQLQEASDSWIAKNHGKFIEMQNEYKKQFKKVYGHSNYRDPNDYAKGGAIYKGDRVKVKSTNKRMVVENISKGKKGYVEFTGKQGTYLKGDLEKYNQGGTTSGYCYSIGGL